MAVLWNPFSSTFENRITLIISILALSGTVWTLFNTQKNNRDKRLNNKEFVLIQIAGFYKRFESQYKISNMISSKILSPTIETLINVDKKIIINDHAAFYNHDFNEKYKRKITEFLLALFEWKGYVAKEHIGIFKEIELLSIAEQ